MDEEESFSSLSVLVSRNCNTSQRELSKDDVTEQFMLAVLREYATTELKSLELLGQMGFWPSQHLATMMDTMRPSRFPVPKFVYHCWTLDGGYYGFNLIVASGHAHEKPHELNIIDKMRNTQIKMTVNQAGPDGKCYLVFLRFLDFSEPKKIIVDARKGLTTWEPSPTPKSHSELASGQLPEKDNR